MKEKLKERVDEFIENPKRAVWILAAPMIAGFTVHALYSVVDTIFIGRLGSAALAAATFVGALFFVAIALGVGFATGVTATVAQAVGRKDRALANRLTGTAIGLGLLIGLGFSAFGLLFGAQMMPLLGAEAESAKLAWEYFQILAAGMPFMFVSVAIRAVLTGEGDAKTPMIVLTISTLTNVGLDPFFIFTLDLGIRGAALATVAAQIFSFAVFAYVMLARRKTQAKLRLSHLFPKIELLQPIVRIGLPAALGQLVMALGAGLFNRILAVFGQTAVAGYGAGSKVDLVVALPIVGLASAAVSVVGMFAGAGRPNLVRFAALYTYRVVLVLAVACGVVVFFSSRAAIGLFTDDPHSLEVGQTYLKFSAFAYPLMAFGMTSGRILQGLGFGMPSLVITTLRVIVIAMPTAYLAVYIFDAPLETIWMAMIGAGIVSNIVAFIWIRAHVWRRDPTARALGRDAA